jgi:hypothetical protein
MRIRTGDILLPKFQRDFVWPRKKILGLLDSIAKNYPIGSVLLWQSYQELANERSIADLEIAEVRPGYPVNYLLDGQQRLSTICGALYWQPGGDPKSLWNIAYDLTSEKFVHLQTLDDPPLSQVPMRYLAEPAVYFRRISALDNEQLRSRADALFNRFQNYMIAAVTLGDMSIHDIAPIFERINSTGTPLTVVDLMNAATWSPDFDLRASIDGILETLTLRDFGGIERKTVLRAVSAAAGFGFAVDDMDRLRTKAPDQLKPLLDDVDEASRRAVDFLTTHIRAPRAEALPYANQFAVLTEIFRRIKAGNPNQFAAMERWFWRTTVSGYFGGWNTGQMAKDFRAVQAFAEGDGTDIEVESTLPRADIWWMTQFRSNSAVSKMLALILSYHNPQDLLTGQRIDARKSLSWSTDREYHHVFPKDYLKEGGRVPARANAVANIVLLTSASNIGISSKAPSDYIGAIIQDIGRPAFDERASTVLIPPDAIDAALADDYDSFLRTRGDFLQRVAFELAGYELGGAAEELVIGEDEIPITDPATDEGSLGVG